MKICAYLYASDIADGNLRLIQSVNEQKYRDFDLFVDGAIVNKCDGLVINTIPGEYTGKELFYFKEKGYDYVWIVNTKIMLRDDTLLELVESTKHLKRFSFVTSSVFNDDNKLSYVPELSPFEINGIKTYSEKLEYNLLRISSSTL